MLTIYTDGACSGNAKNSGSGGWAYVMLLPCGTIHQNSGHVSNTTNNRMELTAIIKALESSYGMTTVISDSQYCVKGITEWIYGWKINNWKSSTGKPVENKDLWEQLDKLVRDNRSIIFKWVRGHDGNEYNEVVDKLAVSASKGG